MIARAALRGTIGAVALLALSLSLAQTRAPSVMVLDSVLRSDRETDLRWPVALAAGSNLEIAVADAFESKVVFYASEGGSWSVDQLVKLPRPPIAMAHAGERYIVALRGAPALVALEGPEHLLRNLKLPAGVVPGALAAGPSGELLLYDLSSRELLRMKSGGSFQRLTSIEGRPSALSVGPGGSFLASFAADAQVRRFGADGSLLESWEVPGESPLSAWPVAVGVEPTGDVLVVDGHGARIVLLGARGRVIGLGSRRGWEPGLLLNPVALSRLPDGRWAVADRGNGNVQIFRRTDQSVKP